MEAGNTKSNMGQGRRNMSDSKVNSGSNAKEKSPQPVSQDTPGLSELLKAQIRLIAIQRNIYQKALDINARTMEHQAMQQEAAKVEAEFQAAREKVQQATGLVYNDEKLTLDPKSVGPKSVQ
jgi:hypothetical protein